MKTYTGWTPLVVAAGTDLKGDNAGYFAYTTYMPSRAFVDLMRKALGPTEGSRMVRDIYQNTKVANRSYATSKSDKVGPEELQKATIDLARKYMAEGMDFEAALDKAGTEAATVAKASHGTLKAVSKTEYLAVCEAEDLALKAVLAD